MISSYFDASSTLLRFHESVVGKYLDAFAASLGAVGYSHATVRLYLRAVVHLGAWAQRRKLPMASLDEEALRRFRQHLSRCRCGWRDHKGRFQGSVRAADLFLAFLRHCDAIPPAKVEVARPPFEDELGRFRLWMIQRRGLATPREVPASLSRRTRWRLERLRRCCNSALRHSASRPSRAHRGALVHGRAPRLPPLPCRRRTPCSGPGALRAGGSAVAPVRAPAAPRSS